jgi:hypothetical protein
MSSRVKISFHISQVEELIQEIDHELITVATFINASPSFFTYHSLFLKKSSKLSFEIDKFISLFDAS